MFIPAAPQIGDKFILKKDVEVLRRALFDYGLIGKYEYRGRSHK